MKVISAFFVSLTTLVICLFLNGNLPLNNYIPPFGKLLFPKTGLWQNAELFTKNYTVKNEAISNEVEIIFDDRMVPHIYAENISDALFAQGYIQARDRLFQLDLSSRSAAGELAEIVGEVALPHDLKMRKIGMKYHAEKTAEKWKANKNNQLLESYCAGINAYINSLSKKEYPFEFKLMDYAPQQWSATKSALIQKQMESMLCGAEEDIQLTNLKTTLGDSLFKSLYPDRNPYDSPIIPNNVKYSFDAKFDDYSSSMNVTDTFPHKIIDKNSKGIGSNNWVISAEKSKTNHPILANDPHLRLSLPAIWHEVHIVTPKINARGVGIPGVPGILIGFNKNIAWGTTNVGQDVKDYYKIKYLDESKSTYELGGKSMNITLRAEQIPIRTKPDTTIVVKETVWGPIIHDSSSSLKDLAMSWLPYQRKQFDDFLIFVDIISAKNYAEFETIMNHYQTPAQNFVAASIDGSYGLRVTGLFPAKQHQDGRFVKDGSNPKSGYDTYIPYSQLPNSINPDRGFVSSANQYSTAANYPYYYSSQHFENYRGRRINTILEKDSRMGVEDMMKMQADVFNIKASEILPLFLAVIDKDNLNSLQKKYIQAIENWNYDMLAHEIGPTIFTAWYNKYKKLVFDEIHQLSKRMSVSYPDPWKLYDLTLNQPNHIIFDHKSTSKHESASAIINQAFQEISESDTYLKTWSNYRNFTIPHLAKIDGLGSHILDVNGNGDVINAIDNNYAPSWRMIVALGEETEAYGVFPGGQSGNPNSKFYNNSIEKWVKGEYHKLELLEAKDIDSQSLNITLKSK